MMAYDTDALVLSLANPPLRLCEIVASVAASSGDANAGEQCRIARLRFVPCRLVSVPTGWPAARLALVLSALNYSLPIRAAFEGSQPSSYGEESRVTR